MSYLKASVVAACALLAVDTAAWLCVHSATLKLERSNTACKSLLKLSSPWLAPASRWLHSATGKQLATCGEEGLRMVGNSLIIWVPTDPTGYLRRAQAESLAKRWGNAKEELLAALARRPHSPFLLRSLALAYKKLGDYKGCIQYLVEAEARAPGFGQPPVETLPEDDKRIRLLGLERSVLLYPGERSRLIARLGREFMRQGRWREAERVLRTNSGYPEVALELADFLIGRGRWDEAAPLLLKLRRRILTRRLEARRLSLLSQAALLSGDRKSAELLATRAMKVFPEASPPYLAFAKLLERQGDIKGAVAYVEAAWAMEPRSVKLLLEMARLADKAGDVGKKQWALSKLCKLRPEEPRYRAMLVSCLMEQGDLVGAALTLSRALEAFPSDPQLLELAVSLASRRRWRR